MRGKKTSRQIKIKQYELPVKIVSEKEGGFTVTCSLWPDCFAQGDTVDEVMSEITGVVASLIELYQEEGLDIPLSRARRARVL